ncbi:MAG: hypothetical protein H7841_09765 [Magnetospirillum sp. WYHS-4]
MPRLGQADPEMADTFLRRLTRWMEPGSRDAVLGGPLPEPRPLGVLAEAAGTDGDGDAARRNLPSVTEPPTTEPPTAGSPDAPAPSSDRPHVRADIDVFPNLNSAREKAVL